jgi:hypothetical protein
VLFFLIIARNFNNRFIKLLFGFLLIYISGIYTAYITGHLDLKIISGYANYMKLVGGYDEIAREWKTSAKLIYDYFITGVISENLSQLISNMNSYAVLSNKYDKIFIYQNFSLSTFLFFYSHYFYFTLIAFVFLFICFICYTI